MAKSYRGKTVDMVSLAKKYEKTVALGNAHMNGRGDILGKGGKVVKTREEQLAEYYEGNQQREITVNLKKDATSEVEQDLKKMAEEDEIRQKLRARPRTNRTPVYEDVTEEEKAEIDSLKKGE